MPADPTTPPPTPEEMAREQGDRDADTVASLLSVIAAIREKSGVGTVPMLSELPEAIASAIASAVEAERAWQDMDSAPKDGTWFLVWPGETEDGLEVVRCKWQSHPDYPGWQTDAYDCAEYEFNPTMWTPLPPPPRKGGQTTPSDTGDGDE